MVAQTNICPEPKSALHNYWQITRIQTPKRGRNTKPIQCEKICCFFFHIIENEVNVVTKAGLVSVKNLISSVGSLLDLEPATKR